MAKYTTLVRSICETDAGLVESVGGNKVDEVVGKAWGKVFTSNVNFFDSAYKEGLCKKILKHYYMREIGFETAGLWKMAMNRKLEEIMPYYNQLYSSELLKFEPLKDVDYQEEFDRKSEDVRSDSKHATGNSNQSGNSLEKFADTPQGSVTNVLNGSYLSSATSVDSNGNGDYEENSSGSGSDDFTDHYLRKYSGKRGMNNYSRMLMDFRETFLNIDMLVVEEFEELFMQIW